VRTWRAVSTRLKAVWGPLLLLAVGVVVALLILEVFLRTYNPFGERLRGDALLLPAHMRREIRNSGFPRVDSRIIVSTNSLGFRGPEPPADFTGALTVVAVGGSTTESLYVSDGKTWPELVGRDLSSSFSRFWVNNAGLDGHSTFGHRLLLDQRLARLRPKVALFLVGLNDVGREDLKAADGATVAGGGRDSPFASLLAWAARRSAVVSTGFNLARYREAKRLDRVHRHLEIRWAPVVSPDPDRSRALLALHVERYVPPYAGRIADLVARCRRYGIEPVFITQPALYGNVVDPQTKVFLGTVAVDSDRALSGGLAWRELELYNDAVRRVCGQLGVLVVDLAHVLPKDSRLFYDFVHFNNDGSEAVASIVSAALCPFLVSRFPDHVAGPCPAPEGFLTPASNAGSSLEWTRAAS
jgi:lysophospholipase L1-like esterase